MIRFFGEYYGKIVNQTYAMSWQLLPRILFGNVDVQFTSFNQ
jgi:hypothetical protein